MVFSTQDQIVTEEPSFYGARGCCILNSGRMHSILFYFIKKGFVSLSFPLLEQVLKVTHNAILKMNNIYNIFFKGAITLAFYIAITAWRGQLLKPKCHYRDTGHGQRLITQMHDVQKWFEPLPKGQEGGGSSSFPQKGIP